MFLLYKNLDSQVLIGNLFENSDYQSAPVRILNLDNTNRIAVIPIVYKINEIKNYSVSFDLSKFFKSIDIAICTANLFSSNAYASSNCCECLIEKNIVKIKIVPNESIGANKDTKCSLFISGTY